MPLDRPRASGYSSPLTGRLGGRSRSRLREFSPEASTSTSSSCLSRGRSGGRHYSRDSSSRQLRIRPRPLSPPSDLPVSYGRSLRLSSLHRSPRRWPSSHHSPEGARCRSGSSPPLRHSLDGQAARHLKSSSMPITAGQIKSRLPAGVVVFPSGGMLATAAVGVSNPNDLRHREFDQSGPRHSKFEVVPCPVFTDDDLARLDAHFRILRPTFPVRCRYKICSTLRGPCKERWCNMITVPGVLLRRMECESCGLQYLLFPWGGKFRDSACVQAEVLDQNVRDPFQLGYPRSYFSWR